MAARLFAVLRSIVVSIIFVSIWTWFVPRWIVGRNAFDETRPFGWIVIALGVVIAFGCALEFAWRGIGTPAPFDPPRRLVITGLYRWVRNPMYVGLGVLLLGEAITFPRLTITMLVMIAALWLATTIFIITFEEPTLRSKFGDDYAAYCRNVRRWIPRMTPFRNG
ncbi:MAG: isoprenylcysteine carboxylmethyltransferase family protein [Acidobacteria bacterium]|nr:isoprenylcysteine carboxylmethyltransferase family protein [Acidobacteriota bacterium]MBV9068212.1 isoprenylcysteine carboxylmethyltransferase family protein [Acidobacteriota bacterium]MBV9185515.1 isoprenylcysteine carboxylmethyltransferase family protein [Acidobacteriota bacterium]